MTRVEFLEVVASSPWYRLIGMRPRLEGGRVVVELEVDRRHHQAFGTAHGGVIAALLDSAVGLNASAREQQSGTGKLLPAAKRSPPRRQRSTW